MPEIADMHFQIGDPAVEVAFEPFLITADAASCNYAWTYTVTSATDLIGGLDISAYVQL